MALRRNLDRLFLAGCIPAEPVSVSPINSTVPQRTSGCQSLKDSLELRSFQPQPLLASLLECFGQFLLPLGENLLLMPFQHILQSNVAQSAMQVMRVVILLVPLDQPPCVIKRQRSSQADVLGLQTGVAAF